MTSKSLCKIDNCCNKVHQSGYCGAHFNRYRDYGDPLGGPPIRQFGRKCSIEGCERKHAGRGYCQTHLKRLKKYGYVDPSEDRSSKIREWVEANKNYQGDDCLKWPFSVSDHGRGRVTYTREDGSQFGISAPKAMCIAAYGHPESDGLEAAHSCGNGHLGCMNPRHLRWATKKENAADRIIHGTERRGSKINTNKLTEDQVRYIRSRYKKQTGVSLAREFGITTSQISSIQRRTSWKWLD